MPTTARLTYNILPQLARKMKPAAMEVVGETLEEIDVTVQTGMAASGSPSAPGAMPGIDTGALAASLQQELSPANYEGIYYTGQEYAPYLEYSTTTMAARPFMTPAAERARPGFMRKMSNLESKLK